MSGIFRFPTATEHDAEVRGWFDRRTDALGTLAREWFDLMRERGPDVRELLHDGHPTACVGDAAFGYVDAFTGHVNVGFYRGAELADPTGMLQGAGKSMRHVKLRPDAEVDPAALTALIQAAYRDMKRRVDAIR